MKVALAWALQDIVAITRKEGLPQVQRFELLDGSLDEQDAILNVAILHLTKNLEAIRGEPLPGPSGVVEGLPVQEVDWSQPEKTVEVKDKDSSTADLPPWHEGRILVKEPVSTQERALSPIQPETEKVETMTEPELSEVVRGEGKRKGYVRVRLELDMGKFEEVAISVTALLPHLQDSNGRISLASVIDMTRHPPRPQQLCTVRYTPEGTILIKTGYSNAEGIW